MKKTVFVVAIATFTFINHFALAEILSWSCGTNCTLTLNTETKHAIVSGTGDMQTTEGYSPNKNAWRDYVDSFESIEIQSGITSIGDGAFSNVAASSISIPDTVTKIGNMAFIDAHSLTKIEIPNSVVSIGDWAFNRTALRNVVIPDSVQTLGMCAFFGTPLQTLTIPDGLVFAEPTSKVQNPSYYIKSTFGTLQNVICSGSGDTSKCDEILRQGGKNIQSVSKPNYLKDADGNIIGRYEYDLNGNFLKLTSKNADGSIYSYDSNGKLIGIQGKRILTVDEANALVKNNKNTFSIRYR